MRGGRWFVFPLLLALVVTAQDRRVAPVGSSRRMALVIGNNAYPWRPLTNAVNDANALAAALPSVGFQPGDVTLVTDASLRQLQRAAREFLEKLKPDDVALVYYSGHGVEVHGENFLIPVDFPANASELEVQDDAYSAQQLLQNLEATRARVRLMILDACRDNPLRTNRSAGGGLARMDGQGTLIVFATGAGQTADDNPAGANGLFTSRLLRALPTPGLPIEQLIKQVAREVYQDSRQRQTPAVYGMLLEDFAFVPGAAAAAGPGAVPGRDLAAEQELAFWNSIKDSSDQKLFAEYLRRFPDGLYRVVAERRIEAPSTIRAPLGAVPFGNSAGEVWVNAKDGLKYVWIPPGRFLMGCALVDSDCDRGEWPAHEVTITKGFWLGQTPVTQLAYQRITGYSPSRFKGANLPVEMVTWDEAQSYCRAIGGRLPTEAEWEYAARAGTTGPRYGNLDEIAWYRFNSGSKSHEGAQKAPNAWGLYDMLGNMWQWTADWHGDYQPGAQNDPSGPANGQYRVLRGGSFDTMPAYTRVSFRLPTDGRGESYGFRCVGK